MLNFMGYALSLGHRYLFDKNNISETLQYYLCLGHQLDEH